MEKDYEDKLAPAPANEVPLNAPPEPNVEAREALDRNGDGAVRQHPAFQENPQPEEPNQRAAMEEGDNDLVGLPFPRKLWAIAENQAFNSVRWNDVGDGVIIQVDRFQREILHRRGPEKIFETDSLKGFIHQLNLHGFSKIRPRNASGHPRKSRRIMIYRNCNFQRGKPGLLQNIWRKGERRSPASKVTFIPTRLRNPARESRVPTRKRKQLEATRRSPRFHKHNQEDEKAQKEAPSEPGPRDSPSFMFSGVWAMSSVPECPSENGPPQEPSVPSGEGTSGHNAIVPLAAAGMEGAGEVPDSSSEYPDDGPVKSLYNTCYSMIMASLLAMAPNESSHDDDDEEEASAYKYVLCEPLKANPRP